MPSLVILARRRVRDLQREALLWGAGLGAMCALMAAIWPSVADSISTLVDSYPSGLKEAFGIQRLDSAEAYIDAEMLSLIVPLALAVLAVRCATRGTVGAEERGHLDVLLSLPVGRRALVAAGYAATGVVLAEILTIVWALTWTTAAIAGAGLSAATLAAGLANVWPLAMAVAGVGVLAAGFQHRLATVTATATGVLLVMYVIDLTGRLAKAIEPLRVISAFRYYGSAVRDGIDVSHVLTLIVAGLLATAIGAIAFDRRDVL